MNNYEKSIGLKTIWLTIVRRFKYILLIFVPLLLVTFLVTQFGITKNYQSSVTFLRTSSTIATADYQRLQAAIIDADVLTTVSFKDANDAGNKAAQNNSTVYTQQEIR